MPIGKKEKKHLQKNMGYPVIQKQVNVKKKLKKQILKNMGYFIIPNLRQQKKE